MSNNYIPEERRNKIYSILKKAETISVKELAEKFNVSEMTIRRDLDDLEKENLLRRTYGGAALNKKIKVDLEVENRLRKNKNLKEKIAQKAVELIGSDECIALDASTTALQMAKFLPDRNDVIVITNGILTSHHLANYDKLKVILAGGEIRKDSLSCTGAISQEIIERFIYTHIFLSANAVNTKTGVNDTDISEIGVKRSMIRKSRKVILLADSTKLQRESFSTTCSLQQIDLLITDDMVEEETIEEFENANVEILIAE